MIKTAEVSIPQTVDTRPTSSRLLLYNAFRNLIVPETAKQYSRWRKDRNNRWLGGLTAVGQVEGFEAIPVSVVLRESKGMVQLLAINADVYKLDMASNYKKDGWEFSDRDPRVLMNAVTLKNHRVGEVFVSYRTQEKPLIISDEKPEFGEEDLKIMVPLIRQLGFERMVEVLSRSGSCMDTATQILTSPLWRHYNYPLEGVLPNRGGRWFADTPADIAGYKNYGTN